MLVVILTLGHFDPIPGCLTGWNKGPHAGCPQVPREFLRATDWSLAAEVRRGGVFRKEPVFPGTSVSRGSLKGLK